MKLVMKNICGLLMLGVIMIGAGTLMSMTPQNPLDDIMATQQPEIPKMNKFSGDIFKNFAEFRVQRSSFSTLGIITLE